MPLQINPALTHAELDGTDHHPIQSRRTKQSSNRSDRLASAPTRANCPSRRRQQQALP
jgi:hypothetical protein